ncbi:MAG: hydrogenase formation protein HypD [Candidatus Omnitrophota bacterium]
MKYVDEFRDRKIIDKLASEIREAVDPGRQYNIMEVCGTHTMNVFRFGLRSLLTPNINLISGPGCPVCVTPNEYLDKAIWLAGRNDIIIATFGDMFRVPGSYSSLEKEKVKGNAIKMVYSTTDALALARKNPRQEVVFLGIGFETTIPTVAQSIIAAKREGIKNYSVLCGHKTMPAALKAIAEDKKIRVDGFLLPGHVSAVIGAAPYVFLAKKYCKRCVITGFEPADILQAILMVVRQKTPRVEIQYTRIIAGSGNFLARKSIERVFKKSAAEWRGMGKIKDSGLEIRPEFKDYDADVKFKPKPKKARENKACICGDVIKGVKKPADCKLFGKICNPISPVGSCMVSSEGTCSAYYKYSYKL